MLKKRLKHIIIILILLSPVFMFLAWFFTPKTKMVAAIIDKTVLTTEGQEHISLDWVLNYKKYTKTSTKFYKRSEDYFGFFPKENEQFDLRGLERFPSNKIEQLSNDADLVYFTDTYGIYTNEWYEQNNQTERSGIVYGGLKENDMEFLQKMKDKNKLIITEFNTFGSPTAYDIRRKFERTFGLQWTGWTGRYFDNLDTLTNKELPRWLIKNYLNQHGNKWPFKKSGVAFVNENDQVTILEDSIHLEREIPQIISNDYGKKRFSLPDEIKYPFWFDIVQNNSAINKTAANYKLYTTEKGSRELKKYGIPTSFPAVTYHLDSDYEFYYFSGDFCDNPITMGTSYFKGIGIFKRFFYNDRDKTERASFFWKFYRPMLQKILEDYEKKISTKNNES